MGQGQSSSGGAAQPDEAPAKTDYYELLGVERQATDDEIKKAYRRKALELHPDRNYGNVDQATALFAEIQTAYEVLSDPQERAWYDSHRDVLLRGGDPAGAEGEEFSYNIRMTTVEDVMKLMMKFNGRLNFTDSSDGFYGGLTDFFQQLAKEEEIACQWENTEPVEYPVFGHKDDDYDDVVRPFYAIWNGFATRKSYSWKDQYRLSDAPDRRVRRMMEKENKRIREDAVREFNDAVRSLIAFVRKRDPRYQENLKSEAQRQQTLREAAAAQAARSRAANKALLENHVVQEWAKSEAQHDDPFDDEDEESEEEQIECVVCNKTFKSEKQFEAHEKSKKHIKLLKQLKREMKEDDAMLTTETKKPTSKPKPQEEPVSENDEPVEELQPTSKPPPQTNNESEEEEEEDQESTKKPVNGESIPSKSSPPTSADDSSASDSEDSDYASREKVASRLINDLDLSDSPSSNNQATPKLGKAKLKRAKKAAAAATTAQEEASNGFTCSTCGEQFPSKTKLFNHVRDEGHAGPKMVDVGSGGKAKAKGKGKKR